MLGRSRSRWWFVACISIACVTLAAVVCLSQWRGRPAPSGTDAVVGAEILSALCSLRPELWPGEQRDSLPLVTGFCIDDAGHVVSSLAMLGPVKTVGIKSAATGEFCAGAVVGTDPWTDTLVALPRVDIGLRPATISPAEPRLAEAVWVFGRRLNGPSCGGVVNGIISARRTNGVQEGLYSNCEPLVELTAPFFPGFQGAPVVREPGDVMGVVVGCAVGHRSISVAKLMAPTLAAAQEIIQTRADVRRPDLGFSLSGTQSPDGLALTVRSVAPDGPAGALKVGDKVLSIDGSSVAESFEQFLEVRSSLRAGREVQIVVERGGNQVELAIVPDEYVRPVMEFEEPFWPTKTDAESGQEDHQH